MVNLIWSFPKYCRLNKHAHKLSITWWILCKTTHTHTLKSISCISQWRVLGMGRMQKSSRWKVWMHLSKFHGVKQTLGTHRAAYMAYHGKLDLKIDVSHICNEGLCVNLKHMSHKNQAVNFARSVAKTIKSAWVIMINGHVFNSCIITKVRWATFFFLFSYDSNYVVGSVINPQTH